MKYRTAVLQLAHETLWLVIFQPRRHQAEFYPNFDGQDAKLIVGDSAKRVTYVNELILKGKCLKHHLKTYHWLIFYFIA